VAQNIAELLQKNRSFKILNIANNPIQMEGFMEIARAGGANLQVLDVSDCGIVTDKKSEEAFHRTPTLTHQLKVLKLSGNNFVKLSGAFWQYLFGAVRFPFLSLLSPSPSLFPPPLPPRLHLPLNKFLKR
jgi:hypothetical protein